MPLRGTVTDNQDPNQRGRCRVQVWGVHNEQDPNLPWAEVMGSTAFGLHKGVGVSSVLQVGTTVWVEFEQSDLQCPIITGVFVGHDAEEMSLIDKDNSDFHPDAKGDNYGLVQLITTPGGNRFELNDKDPKINLKTPNGFELNLDDKNRKIELLTPCGPGITLDCNNKTVTITNGQASMVFDGPNINVDGHINATGSVKAPNLCYCGSPGPDPTEKQTKEERDKQQKQECEPVVSKDGKNSCDTNMPANKDLGSLDPEAKKLVELAAKKYKAATGRELIICETLMDPSRFTCLTNAGESPEKAQMYGLAVDARPFNDTCDQGLTEEEQEEEQDCTNDKADAYHVTKAGNKPVCYKSANPAIRSLARALFFETKGGTDGAQQRVASVIFNRIKVYPKGGFIKGSAKGDDGIINTIENKGQFDFTYSSFKRVVNENEMSEWDRANRNAAKFYQQWKSGNWQDNTNGAVSYANVKTATNLNRMFGTKYAKYAVESYKESTANGGCKNSYFCHTFYAIKHPDLDPSKAKAPYGPR